MCVLIAINVLSIVTRCFHIDRNGLYSNIFLR